MNENTDIHEHLVCSGSGDRYPVDTRLWRSPAGAYFDLAFTPHFPRDRILDRAPGMWRYREALPFPLHEVPVSFDEGFTPMPRVPIHGHEVYLKQEQLFPSGSYKDRGASMLISHARRIGITHCVEDSSGNAGSAIAAYCARAGISCEIYVPEDTSPSKLAQIRSYGAQLKPVPGNREATAEAVMAAAETSFYASHVWNPYFFHGTKTFAFEVWEQLGFTVPDALILPAGNGTLLIGTAIGFEELYRAGEVPAVPRLYGVQAALCAPLARTATPAPNGDTVAEGIAIARPARGAQILDKIEHSGGGIVTVTEEQISHTLGHLCRQGFFIEPTSAATLAAVPEVLSRPEFANKQPVVVSLCSGHGLKAAEKVEKLVQS